MALFCCFTKALSFSHYLNAVQINDRSLPSSSRLFVSETGVFDENYVPDEIFAFGDDDDEDDDEDLNDVVLFSFEDNDNEAVSPPAPTETRKVDHNNKQGRWHTLSQEEKDVLIKEGQERAIRSKKRREPKAEKKRRMLQQFREAQLRDKKAARVRRPLPLYSPKRTPLEEVEVGSVRNGTVISLTDFGAYVDVGTTECDGLIHVSQISREVGGFVSHPRQILKAGDVLENLTVTRAELPRSLQLTMLSEEERRLEADDEEEEDDGVERIALDTLFVDDELWGEIKRVTNFGAYVELGAVVDGFLHFMDHPTFGVVPGQHPSEYMAPGQRVRVWVSHVDLDKERIKLTALRPRSLPRLTRDMRF